MFEIDLKSRVPIYRQIYNKIEQMALSGVLAPGEQILSVRQFAKLAGINPNTITKAYSELEKSEIIYSVTGKGSFISNDLSGVSLSKKNELIFKIKNKIIEAKSIGVDKQAIIKITDEIYDIKAGGENYD